MAKKSSTCSCGCSMHALMFGIGLLIIAAMRYMGYSYREIVVVVGILLVLKGLYKYFKK